MGGEEGRRKPCKAITSISHSAISVEGDHDSFLCALFRLPAGRPLMHNDLNLEFRAHGAVFGMGTKKRRKGPTREERKKCAIF